MPHHLQRISLSSPTPAPLPCCIVYLVFYYLDYTFHISVCLCIPYFYTFHLCLIRSISRVLVLPYSNPTPLWYSVFSILVSSLYFSYFCMKIFSIFLYFSPLQHLQHFQGPGPPLLQPHSPVVLCIWYAIILNILLIFLCAFVFHISVLFTSAGFAAFPGSLSSPTPAPLPCGIVYLVFYCLDYTFHISVCFCIPYFYTFHL